MVTPRKLATLLAAGIFALGVAACGESDVDKARNDVQDKAEELKGNLNDVSKKDLQKKLDEVEDDANKGGEDTKQKARDLKEKIERELKSRG